MQSRQTQLVRGAAKSFDEYQKRVGWMEGLQYAIDAPARITAVVETEREKRKLTG